MATNYITVKGYIKNGELNVDLPDNVVDGDVEVTIPVSDGEDVALSPAGEQLLSDDEIDELMRPEPKTGAEIIAAGHTGGWETRLPHELQDISPGSVIVEMMRTSIWDIYLDILKKTAE